MPGSRRRVSLRLKSAVRKVKGTLWIKVNPQKPQIEAIRIAANVIRKGGLVAFPTETVYGLGANALDSNAVASIFKAKERPADNPVIVHIASKTDLYRLAKSVPSKVEKLAARFWPGPLTLVLKRSSTVPDVTVAGLDTVGIRIPRNKIALALIHMSGVPIAAPSANRAGKPSPTTAKHVMDDLAGRIDIVLDGGSTQVGVESTVIDMTSRVPQILRPGGTSYEELKAVLGETKLHPATLSEKPAASLRARAPGMKHRHYAPKAEMILVEGDPDKVIKRVKELAAISMADGKKVGILATNESLSNYDGDVLKSLGSRNNLAEVAKNLFRLLREFDEENVDIIIAEGVPSRGLGLAVMNRLRRAASFKIHKAS
jgi:L-threonylcarbamoyladenylate synthase